MSWGENPTFQSAFGDMEESPRGNRWSNQEATKDVMGRYASKQNGHAYNIKVHEKSRNSQEQAYVTYHSEMSQVSLGSNPFRKIKFNQLETLKELRQEYEILKTVPVDENISKKIPRKTATKSISESSHQSSVTESSKVSGKNKSLQTDQRTARNIEILTLEKKQLELVIGNSMRKIEQLLNGQIDYKRMIHELNTQLDSRNTDQKIEHLNRIIRRNESQYKEQLNALSREIQKYKFSTRQIEQKLNYAERELEAKDEQVKKYWKDIKSLQDRARLDKEKFMSQELQTKRVLMEKDIMQKDKNNEINRLKSIVEQLRLSQTSSYEFKRLQEQLHANKQKYETLLYQFDRYKTQVREAAPKKEAEDGQAQFKIFEKLLDHLKHEASNQNRASIDLVTSMMQKFDRKPEKKTDNKGQESNKILEELFNIRNQLSVLKEPRNDISANMIESIADYNGKIKILQKEIENGSISKENLLKQYEIIKSSYEYSKSQYEKLNEQYVQLRRRLEQYEQQGTQNMRESEEQYQSMIRDLTRKLDEKQFILDKTIKQGEYNLSLLRNEYEAKLRLKSEEIHTVLGEKQQLRQQINKMRAFYEQRIKQKNAHLQRITREFKLQIETKETSMTGLIKKNEQELGQLVAKLQSMAELQKRFTEQSATMAFMEKQLFQLRTRVRRMKGINDNVDHLWVVKETQYSNVNDLLKMTRQY